MGNCCCCRQIKSPEVTHGDNVENLQDNKVNTDGEISVHSTDGQTYFSSRYLSDGSINFSLFSFESGVPTDYQRVSEFCVEDPLDLHPCHVTGMTCLPDGSTVMIDAKNKKIKVYTPDFEYAYVQKARGGIRDVEYIEQNEIAVTEGKCICFYKVENRYITKQVKKFILDEYLGSIAYNGRLIAVQCGTKGYMHIKLLDKEGAEKYDITLRTIVTSLKRFNESIALDNQLDVIYVTDTKNKCVTCSDFLGNILWSTPSQEFGFPKCLISLDYVVICADWAKNRIFRISPDGSKVSPIIQRGLRKPSFITFQLLQNRLVVYANNRRLVQVFQISVSKQQNGRVRSVSDNFYSSAGYSSRPADALSYPSPEQSDRILVNESEDSIILS